MPALYEIRIELQEKGEQQQTNVHAVYVGIRGYHNIVVTQVVELFVDI